MNSYYTDERNAQILIYLMKAHGIRKVIISPGATNVCFVGSLQQDKYFELYSSVDERSAAYMACGLAAESNEPVALSCTGATASRNYLSGLTEAYYRKLPILAITATMHIGRIGQNIPQMIDRTNQMNDIARISVHIPTIHDKEDEWAYSLKINAALLELTRHGGGPVHIDLATEYSPNFNIKELPISKIVKRIHSNDCMPELNSPCVAIFVGAHKKWTDKLITLVDKFCEIYNGAVLCDHTSNYSGKYRIFPNLVVGQEQYISPYKTIDLLIDLGDVSGAYIALHPERVWRVNPDGELRDRFKGIQYIFEMDEQIFFEKYIKNNSFAEISYYIGFKNEYDEIFKQIPEVPFSNIWTAQQMHSRLPKNSVIHLGILNTLRSWNFFETSKDILMYANTGGFGIDGCLSALIGASLASPEKIFFGIVGDLAFFYDMNVIGNRHINSNVRIMVINNGKGAEFKNYNHAAAYFGDMADEYIAASGHYGKQSSELIKNYVQSLKFDYICADSKDSFLEQIDFFLTPDITEKPILFEVFTNTQDESNALYMMNNIKISSLGVVKKFAKGILGVDKIPALKNVVKEK